MIALTAIDALQDLHAEAALAAALAVNRDYSTLNRLDRAYQRVLRAIQAMDNQKHSRSDTGSDIPGGGAV